MRNLRIKKEVGILHKQEARKIFNFLKEATEEDGILPNSAVVISPRTDDGRGLADVINKFYPELNAKFFIS